MIILELLALFCCGTFFGAAVYISLAQHPAALQAGVAVGGRFFPPMYNKAAPMQVTLALLGFLSGMVVWYQTLDIIWFIGAVLLFSVIPVTLVLIKPVNDILLSPENDPDSMETESLLREWGPKHAWRSIMSGVAFVLYLYAGLSV